MPEIPYYPATSPLSYVSFRRQVHLVLDDGTSPGTRATLCRAEIHHQTLRSPVAHQDINDLHTDLLCRKCAERFLHGGYRDYALKAYVLRGSTIHTEGHSFHPIGCEKQLNLF